MNQKGFSLVELMISLALGVVISGAIIQVMVSNKVTEQLNRSVASAQESGRFIVSRLRNELLMTGRYDPLSPELNRSVDIVQEASFVQNHPIIFPNDFTVRDTLGSKQGASGASDTLVVALQTDRDCRGYKLGYAANEEFFVVNEYFLDGDKLKCRGFDGRYLRGQKVAVGHNGHNAFTLLDGVQSFQVLYGVSNSANGNNATPVRYLTADAVPAQLLLNNQVLALRIAVIVEGDGNINITKQQSFSLLNESAVEFNTNRIYKQFETTVTLRNVKNFMRNRKI